MILSVFLAGRVTATLISIQCNPRHSPIVVGACVACFTPLSPPPLCPCHCRYPTKANVRDYFAWRQADCHVNNLYNTGVSRKVCAESHTGVKRSWRFWVGKNVGGVTRQRARMFVCGGGGGLTMTRWPVCGLCLRATHPPPGCTFGSVLGAGGWRRHDGARGTRAPQRHPERRKERNPVSWSVGRLLCDCVISCLCLVVCGVILSVASAAVVVLPLPLLAALPRTNRRVWNQLQR